MDIIMKLRYFTAAMLIGVATLAADGSRGATPHFFSDDPLQREPETQDASKAEARETDLFYDFVYNSFVTPRRGRAGVRAGNVNTADEVPDSSWYTNRLFDPALTLERLALGPNTLDATRIDVQSPDRPLTVIRAKTAGAAPGFVARCANGETWYITLDPKGHDEAATGALMVASRLFWALGYNIPEQYLSRIRPDLLQIADTARVATMSGRKRQMIRADLDAIFARAAARADGSYRVIASRQVPGRVIGHFAYEGTRNDDPNDIVPHQHRRELRALQVFGAWTNLVDVKANNTLDTVVTDNGRGIVKHYLQDVGSAFGIGANGPHDYDEGYEHVYQGDTLVRRLVSFGFYLSPWQTAAKYENHRAIGRFEAATFDPRSWKPRMPVAALLELGEDDAFWAARRVAAFTDEMIRRAVATAEYSDPEAARYLGDVLIARRDKVARAYLAGVGSLVDLRLGAEALTFTDYAVVAGGVRAPQGGYRAAWSRFDNATGETTAIGDTTGGGTRLATPVNLPLADGVFVQVAVRAVDGGTPQPTVATFLRADGHWRLVGVSRVEDCRTPLCGREVHTTR
jgi:hypothetical protein